MTKPTSTSWSAPDVGLGCGARRPDSMLAAGPRLVVEVLSPSTRDFDAFEKLEEYKAVSRLDHILLVEPNQPLVVLLQRSKDGDWARRTVEGLDAAVELPELGLTLPMSAIYDGIAFPQLPRLVG